MNPDSQDTMRGIVEWWILKQRIAETESEVEAAVAELVAKGKLSEHVGVDGQVSYRLRIPNGEAKSGHDRFQSEA
jgi:hypothetical protein